MTVMYGSQSSFGVFFKPMSSEFGWSRAETAGPFALNVVVTGFLSIFSGRIGDRFGCQKLVSIGGVFLGVGYILMSHWSRLMAALPVLRLAGRSRGQHHLCSDSESDRQMVL